MHNTVHVICISHLSDGFQLVTALDGIHGLSTNYIPYHNTYIIMSRNEILEYIMIRIDYHIQTTIFTDYHTMNMAVLCVHGVTDRFHSEAMLCHKFYVEITVMVFCLGV